MKTAALFASFLLVACGPPLPEGNRGGGGGGGGGGRDAGLQDAGGAGGQDAGPGGQDAGPNDTGGGGTDAGPPSSMVAADCIDGRYREELPTPGVSIDDAVRSYEPAAWRDYVFEVLTARYPFGAELIGRALEEAPEQLGDCLDRFLRGNDSPATIDRQLGTFVHECGHFLDIGLGWGGGGDAYVIGPDLTLTCAQGDSIERRGRTFARSRIRRDAFGPARPPCDEGARDCDTYADIYLNGNPDDGNFDSGDQGFNMLMEEAFQYVNSLATSYAFNDRVAGSTSARDGILTHLWWVTRYLNMARNEYPEAHDFLLGDDCWREAILSLWGRAWLYLELSKDMGQLGINDAAIYRLLDNPTLLAEIEAVREAEGCR